MTTQHTPDTHNYTLDTHQNKSASDMHQICTESTSDLHQLRKKKIAEFDRELAKFGAYRYTDSRYRLSLGSGYRLDLRYDFAIDKWIVNVYDAHLISAMTGIVGTEDVLDWVVADAYELVELWLAD